MAELGHIALRVRDPEDNQSELFADNPAVDWRTSSQWIEMPSTRIRLDELTPQAAAGSEGYGEP